MFWTHCVPFTMSLNTAAVAACAGECRLSIRRSCRAHWDVRKRPCTVKLEYSRCSKAAASQSCNDGIECACCSPVKIYFSYQYDSIEVKWNDPCPRHEGIRMTGDTAPLVLNFGTGWRWVVCFTPRPLYPRGRVSGHQWKGNWTDPRAVWTFRRKLYRLPVSESQFLLCSP
jgi:hypothetical protein